MSATFGNAGLQWRAPPVFNGEFEQILSDDTIKAVWIDGLDRVSKKLWRAVLDIAGAKMIWATVTVLDEDDFDLEPVGNKKTTYDFAVSGLIVEAAGWQFGHCNPLVPKGYGKAIFLIGHRFGHLSPV